MKYRLLFLVPMLILGLASELRAQPEQLKQLAGEIDAETIARNEWNAMISGVGFHSFPPRAESEITSRIGKIMMFRGTIVERATGTFQVKAGSNTMEKGTNSKLFYLVQVLGTPPKNNSDTVLVSVIGTLVAYKDNKLVIKPMRVEIVGSE